MLRGTRRYLPSMGWSAPHVSSFPPTSCRRRMPRKSTSNGSRGDRSTQACCSRTRRWRVRPLPARKPSGSCRTSGRCKRWESSVSRTIKLKPCSRRWLHAGRAYDHRTGIRPANASIPYSVAGSHIQLPQSHRPPAIPMKWPGGEKTQEGRCTWLPTRPTPSPRRFRRASGRASSASR